MDSIFPTSMRGSADTSQNAMIQQFLSWFEAMIRKNSDQRPRLQLRIPLALDVASTTSKPLYIPDPFTGYYVESSSDTLTNVKISLGSSDQYNTLNYTTVTQKDTLTSDQPVRGCYLTWDAQPGKTMTIVFYLGVHFNPGSYLTQITGGISVSDGSAVAQTSISVSSTATLLAAANTSQKMVFIQNDSGQDLWIGPTNAISAAVPSIRVPTGGSFAWRSSSAVYGKFSAGSSGISVSVFT